MAMNPATPISWVTSAAARPFTLKTDRGRSGPGLRRSLNTKAPSNAIAPASSPTVRAAPQPTSGCPHQRVDQEQHPAGGQHGPDDVEARPAAMTPFGADQAEAGDEHQPADRRVDKEHPAPARALGQEPSQQHPYSRPEPGHRAPGTERLMPVGALLEGRGQDRKSGRQHRGRRPPPGPAEPLPGRPRSRPAPRPGTRGRTPRSRPPGPRRRPSRSADRPPSSMRPPYVRR